MLPSFSMSKSFTSTMVGFLVDEGKLALDRVAPIDELASPDDPSNRDHASDLRHGFGCSGTQELHRGGLRRHQDGGVARQRGLRDRQAARGDAGHPVPVLHRRHHGARQDIGYRRASPGTCTRSTCGTGRRICSGSSRPSRNRPGGNVASVVPDRYDDPELRQARPAVPPDGVWENRLFRRPTGSTSCGRRDHRRATAAIWLNGDGSSA